MGKETPREAEKRKTGQIKRLGQSRSSHRPRNLVCCPVRSQHMSQDVILSVPGPPAAAAFAVAGVESEGSMHSESTTWILRSLCSLRMTLQREGANCWYATLLHALLRSWRLRDRQNRAAFHIRAIAIGEITRPAVARQRSAGCNRFGWRCGWSRFLRFGLALHNRY